MNVDFEVHAFIDVVLFMIVLVNVLVIGTLVAIALWDEWRSVLAVGVWLLPVIAYFDAVYIGWIDRADDNHPLKIVAMLSFIFAVGTRYFVDHMWPVHR